ncbi:C-type lectin domain family 12 member A-like [Balaenoptera ricei]|uniref:C-type lectin domain family 12 member A-like n=1 Tax=Balaenoptera ricei TaxID=2746895 RepID=UPI0028BD9E09|nr:C-type lectin domain family 12 member A-like [Balaenoptera ricei]
MVETPVPPEQIQDSENSGLQVMPEEVTYATLKFSGPKTKEPRESHSLKRMDNHEVPELELGVAAETATGSIEGTAKAAKSRAVRVFLIGRSTPSKVWCPIAFISLLLNLVVLAGLGTLGLTNYYKLIIFGSRTHYDAQETVTERVERTTTLPTNMPTNVSDPGFYLCSELWIWHGSSCCYFSAELMSWNMSNSDHGKNHCSLMNMGNGENWNRTKLLIRCLPSPISWTDLNFTLDNTNHTAENVSNFSILTCLVPP